MFENVTYSGWFLYFLTLVLFLLLVRGWHQSSQIQSNLPADASAMVQEKAKKTNHAFMWATIIFIFIGAFHAYASHYDKL